MVRGCPSSNSSMRFAAPCILAFGSRDTALTRYTFSSRARPPNFGSSSAERSETITNFVEFAGASSQATPFGISASRAVSLANFVTSALSIAEGSGGIVHPQPFSLHQRDQFLAHLAPFANRDRHEHVTRQHPPDVLPHAGVGEVVPRLRAVLVDERVLGAIANDRDGAEGRRLVLDFEAVGQVAGDLRIAHLDRGVRFLPGV